MHLQSDANGFLWRIVSRERKRGEMMKWTFSFLFSRTVSSLFVVAFFCFVKVTIEN